MVEAKLAQKLTDIAILQLEQGTSYKQPRMTEIKKSEDLYLNKKQPALKGRFNVPLPIMSGFVDTLLSKIDDIPAITYTHDDEADYKISKKTTALWQKMSSNPRNQWSKVDRQCKRLAIFSGRGIYKEFTDNVDGFTNYFETVDYADFVCEPNGGSNLENHKFCGQTNVFKSETDLDNGAEDNFYNKKQVYLLKAKTDSGLRKVNDDAQKNKTNRQAALGLNPENYNYVGEQMFNLVEWYMDYEGVRYYLLFDKNTGIWVRCEELTELFSNKLWPYSSWATHEDITTFWSKAPVDDIRPVAEAMKIVFNQTLDNLQKRNWPQKAIDSAIFPELSEVPWRPDGLIVANTSETRKNMKEGIYTLETPDNSTLTVNLMSFLNNFIGEKSGVTPAAQGASDKDTKVGIYYGNMQQVADRLGLYNKSYSEAWAEVGIRFYNGLCDNLNESEAIQYIGSEGVEWGSLTAKELKEKKGDLNINVTGGNAQMQADEILKKTKQAALATVGSNPLLLKEVGPRWYIQEVLRNGGYKEEEIKMAMDKENDADMELMSEAAQAIETIVTTGKMPDINRGANTRFVQKILDFSYDKELKPEIVDKLIAFAQKHIPIAQKNLARKAQSLIAKQGQILRQVPPIQPNPLEQMPGMPGQAPEMPPEPAPGTPEGTASMSQDLSNMGSPA